MVWRSYGKLISLRHIIIEYYIISCRRQTKMFECDVTGVCDPISGAIAIFVVFSSPILVIQYHLLELYVDKVFKNYFLTLKL